MTTGGVLHQQARPAQKQLEQRVEQSLDDSESRAGGAAVAVAVAVAGHRTGETKGGCLLAPSACFPVPFPDALEQRVSRERWKDSTDTVC